MNQADRKQVVIRKHERKLQLLEDGKPVIEFPVVLGFAPAGGKEIEGDGRTPEGEFYIFAKNPKSKFHLSLGISYPSKNDAVRGLEQKLVTDREFELISNALADRKAPLQKTALGGEIYIHGGGIDGDWTDGCVALRDEEMTALFESVEIGTTVTILP